MNEEERLTISEYEGTSGTVITVSEHIDSEFYGD